MKTKNFRFFLNFRNKKKNENFEQSHSAEIHKRGDHWAFWHFSLLQNIQKNLKVGPFEGKKIRKKVTHCQKKLPEKVSGYIKYSNP